MEVSKSDWKLFRVCIGNWQEVYEAIVSEPSDYLLDKVEHILMSVSK